MMDNDKLVLFKTQNSNCNNNVGNILNSGCSIYCELFGENFKTALQLVNSGYQGRIVVHTNNIALRNFWILLRTDWEKLYSKIIQLEDILSGYFTNTERVMALKYWRESGVIIKEAAAEFCTKVHCSDISKHNWDREYISTLRNKFQTINGLLQNIEISNESNYLAVIRSIDSKDTIFNILDTDIDIEPVLENIKGKR